MSLLYTNTDKKFWLRQPQLTRWRHKFRSPRESLKINQEISQTLYDLLRVNARTDDIIEQKDILLTSLYEGYDYLGTTNEENIPSGPPPDVEWLPLGTATRLPGSAGRGSPPIIRRDQPSSYEQCIIYKVSVDGLRDINVEVAVKEPNPRKVELGTIVFFSGGDGNEWWSATATSPRNGVVDQNVEAWMDSYLSEYRRVQVKWAGSGFTDGGDGSNGTGWFDTTEEEEIGPKVAGARPATIMRQIYDDFSGAGEFVVTGHSGGGAQIGYALGFYGQIDIVDRACFTCAPPFIGIYKCAQQIDADLLLDNGDQATYWALAVANKFDRSYGYLGDDTGPCATYLGNEGDYTEWPARWVADGLESSLAFYWPNVVVKFLFGGADDTPTYPMGLDYAALLDDAEMPYVKDIIPDMGHGSHPNPNGLRKLTEHIRGDTSSHTIVESFKQAAYGGSGAAPYTALYSTVFSPTNRSRPTRGNLMVVAAAVATTADNVITPDGWLRDFELDFNDDSFCLVVFSRVTVKGDVNITIDTTTGSPDVALQFIEGQNIKAPIVDVTSGYEGDAIGQVPFDIPTTDRTSADTELAICFVASSGTPDKRFVTRWTDGFSAVDSSNVSEKITAAVLSLNRMTTISQSPSALEDMPVVAAVLTYRQEGKAFGQLMGISEMAIKVESLNSRIRSLEGK